MKAVLPALALTGSSSAVAVEFQGLYEHLQKRYADTVVLTFAQIEDVLGSPLPLTSAQREWWATAPAGQPSSPQSAAWRHAGRSAVPNLTARTVKFDRLAE